MVGCAAALILTAVTGALATNKPDSKRNHARCTAGGCPGSYPYGYPHGAKYLSSSVLALPSPPKTSEEVFYSHGTPAGATNAHPTAGAVFGEGSDIFALSGGSLFGLTSWPPDLQALPVPQGGIFPFVLRDSSDTPIGFGVEMEMLPSWGNTGTNNTHTSDWIVSIPGRGVLWLNSNDNTGSPDLRTFTRPDGSVVTDTTTGPAPGGNGRGVIVGGSGEFAGRTGTWDEYDINKPGAPALGTFEFEMHIHWDQTPTESSK
ncbi:MAG: hypothetical protein AB7V42_15575 [Thermoleophilia bacterium]